MSRQDLDLMSETTVAVLSDQEESSEIEDLPPSPTLSYRSSSTSHRSALSIWGILRGTAINLILPFINGLMLGFGELFAHEAAYRLGWGGTKVFPNSRSRQLLDSRVAVRADNIKERKNSYKNDTNILD